MNGYPRRPAPSRALALSGGGLSLAALAIAVVSPAALAGWLTAFAFWSSLPLGALLMVMMMRIIPGTWREELGPASEAALLLTPLAALAAIPVLAGLPALYGWAGKTGGSGFQGVYLQPWFFTLRTVLFFALSGALAFLLLRRRDLAMPVATVGLIVFVLFHTVIAVDWLMSLDAGFHSSGFGLYVLSIQATIALAALLVVRLAGGGTAERTGTLGGLLLTALLLWAYLAFMQYFIIWSDNLPASVEWYQRRGHGAWAAVEYMIGTLGLAPIFLLLLAPVRRSRAWLIALCCAALLGKALEIAWLVLPGNGAGPAAALAALSAHAGLGALIGAALGEAMRRRDRPAPLVQGEAGP
ncbi:MAG: hypothetical protein AB7S92_01755 [Parvibaculaceae bacterium]